MGPTAFLLVVAATSVWVPVLSAGALVIVGIVGAVATVRVGQQNAVATAKAASERTIAEDIARAAAWQMRKRELYAEFLAAARKVRERSGDADAPLRFRTLRDQVYLFANKDARHVVGELPDDVATETVTDEAWNNLIARLRIDAGQPSE